MLSKPFLCDAAERAASTFAQTLVALVGTDGMGLLNVGLVDSLMASLAASILCVLKAVAAHRSSGTASMMAGE